MDQNEISAIFPVAEEQRRNIESFKYNDSNIIEGSEEYKIVPSSIPSLFYGKSNYFIKQKL